MAIVSASASKGTNRPTFARIQSANPLPRYTISTRVSAPNTGQLGNPEKVLSLSILLTPAEIPLSKQDIPIDPDRYQISIWVETAKNPNRRAFLSKSFPYQPGDSLHEVAELEYRRVLDLIGTCGLTQKIARDAIRPLRATSPVASPPKIAKPTLHSPSQPISTKDAEPRALLYRRGSIELIPDGSRNFLVLIGYRANEVPLLLKTSQPIDLSQFGPGSAICRSALMDITDHAAAAGLERVPASIPRPWYRIQFQEKQ